MNGLGYLGMLPGRAGSAARLAARTSLVSRPLAVSMLEAKAGPDAMRLAGPPRRRDPDTGAGRRSGPPRWPIAQRSRLAEIHDSLLDRITEAERESRLGEIEGPRVSSLAGAQSRIDQTDSASGGIAINLGIPRKAPGRSGTMSNAAAASWASARVVETPEMQRDLVRTGEVPRA
ncbi:hypothetical protein PUR28_18670 [Streptomyces sp. BE308]|uniref:hypothetical protein n=1 Tax=Streptomyces sp. BE308 TaxID=3002529 RepID=UPI002E76C8DA|nr:hypothetical protein [Streptomyces sp. BE308]MEE1792761.1 hypothetical protein [Streptomyces sp. BE308]